MMAAVSKPTVL